VIYPLVALDAAYGATAACIIDASGKIVSAQSTETLQHSQTILPLLSQLMQQAELTWQAVNAFAVGQGPGSFTGLRIAASTLAGLNASMNRPVLPVSSLAITAGQSQCDDIWVVEDARAGEVFVGHYVNGQAVQADACMLATELMLPVAARIASHAADSVLLKLLDKEFERMPLALERDLALSQLVQRELLQCDTYSLPQQVYPLYLQLSQAERMAKHD